MTFAWDADPWDLQGNREAIVHVVWMLICDATGVFYNKMDLHIDLFLDDDVRAVLLEVSKSLEK